MEQSVTMVWKQMSVVHFEGFANDRTILIITFLVALKDYLEGIH